MTYDDLQMYAYVMTLRKIDSQLTESQLEYSFKCLQQGATIVCKEGGIDIYDPFDMLIIHLSDTFLPSGNVQTVTIARQIFEITQKPIDISAHSRNHTYAGASGNNNNNNNNNNNA